MELAERVATEVGVGRGGPTVVRRACGAAAAAALRAEGERLLAAAHPGVVEVLTSEGSDHSWELVLAHGGRPIDLLRPLTASQVAALTAGVATTLADLHDAGIVHGALDASHVLLGSHGRPVLCGFADPSASHATAADDVAAVGALIVALLGPDTGVEPRARRSLLLVADQACADPPTRRPPARRLAGLIAEAIPEPVRRAWRPPRWSAAIVVVGALGTLGLATRWDADPAARDAAPAVTTTTAERALVTTGGRRYEVGQPGDVVRVGDWDCDGTATPAVLRPGSGEVFVFERWPEGGAVQATPTATVADAVALRATQGPEGCAELVVVRTDGSHHVVHGGGG